MTNRLLIVLIAAFLSACGGGIDTAEEALWEGPPAPNTVQTSNPCPTASKSDNPNPVCNKADPECKCAKPVGE